MRLTYSFNILLVISCFMMTEAAYRASVGSNVWKYTSPHNRPICSEHAVHKSGLLKQRFCDSVTTAVFSHYPSAFKIGPVAQVVNCDDIPKWTLNGFVPAHPINASDLSTIYPGTFAQLFSEWNINLRYSSACSLLPDFIPYVDVIGSDFGEPEMRAFIDVMKHTWDGAPVPPTMRLIQIQQFYERTGILHTAELEIYNFDAYEAAKIQEALDCSIPYQRLSTPYLTDLSWRSWGVKYWNTIVSVIPGYNGTTAYDQTLYALRVALSVAKNGGSDINHILHITLWASDPADEYNILRAYAKFFEETSWRPARDGPIFGYSFEQPSIKVAVKMMAWAGNPSDVFQARNATSIFGDNLSDGVQAGMRVYISGQRGCDMTTNRSVCKLPNEAGFPTEGCDGPQCDTANYNQFRYAISNIDTVFATFGLDALDQKYSINYFNGFFPYESSNPAWAYMWRGGGFRPPIRMDEPGVNPGRLLQADGSYLVPPGIMGVLGGWGMDIDNHVTRGVVDPVARFCNDTEGRFNDALSCSYYQWMDLGGRVAHNDQYYPVNGLLDSYNHAPEPTGPELVSSSF